MKADPFVQLRLLDVQELDTKLATLRHQLATLPENAELTKLTEEHRACEDEVRDLRVEVDDLTAEQKKADRDVESVKARRERDKGMVDSGGVKNPKDLERMMHELQSLERRISDLEDVEIEVMERLEDAQNKLEARTSDLSSIEDRRTRVEARRNHRAKELEAEIADVEAERKTNAGGIPGELLALYDRLREHKGGVGAAPLRAQQCLGCRLSLDNSILREIAARPMDDVVRCEECGRILVRTSESGL